MRRLYAVSLIYLFGGLSLLLLACEPLAYSPTPVSVVITEAPQVSLPTVAPSATQTRTPIPSVTPDFTATPTPFPCDETGGQLFNIEHDSESANETLTVRVYVPPCYSLSQRRYPVVYLLHGLGTDETQWEDIGLYDALDQGIRLGVLPPMMIVAPALGRIGQRNSFPPDRSYETLMLDELLPRIERRFCTLNTRETRAIGGISRGGFWAFSIAMRHPDVFASVGGHSAFFPNNVDEIPPAFSPLDLALNSTFLQNADLRMYLDNGISDSSGPSQQLFSSRLSGRGISHTYEVHPVGEHNNDYWATHVSEYLAFYGQNWPETYSALPSCAEPSP